MKVLVRSFRIRCSGVESGLIDIQGELSISGLCAHNDSIITPMNGQETVIDRTNFI